MSEITLNNITKKFGKFKAVDNVSFKIEEKQSVGLVGESGCGKSTIASIIAGLIKPDLGEVNFDGENIFDIESDKFRNYRRNVQMVFQDSSSSLNPRITAGKSIAEPIENFLKLNAEETKAEVEKFLGLVGLKPEDYYKYPNKFSGGQRQRIGIARAISISPKFLLLDEVTSNLDVSVQAQILNLLTHLKKGHDVGMLFISHDLGVVRYMCDKILVMYNGSIVESIAEIDLNEVVHPYSRLLLNSVPTLGNDILKGEELNEVSKTNSGNGCKFYNRCEIKTDRCKNQQPQLKSIGINHEVACFAK